MRSELLINVGAGETRIALVVDGVLENFITESAFSPAARIGDIYLGRVRHVMAATQAAFIDIGQDRDAFLSLRDAPNGAREGEALVVQVTRAALGEKGAKLTAKIASKPDSGKAAPPALLRGGPGALEQALRAADASTDIHIDDARAAVTARKLLPGRDIELEKSDILADVEDQIAALSQPRVTLPCGGWITIEATEALTAIDVNSGGFTSAGERDDTARTVNLEAAREAGRQIRLRGIGGLIVVDFIQMQKDADAIVAVLRQALVPGGVTADISAMSAFGIVAIARQRTAMPLDTMQPCAHCGGSGERASAQATAQAILRAVERAAHAAPGREITVRAAPPIADWLAAHADSVRAGLDRRGVGRVRYISEPRRPEDFDVGT
jgi:ribonuclease G